MELDYRSEVNKLSGRREVSVSGRVLELVEVEMEEKVTRSDIKSVANGIEHFGGNKHAITVHQHHQY